MQLALLWYLSWLQGFRIVCVSFWHQSWAFWYDPIFWCDCDWRTQALCDSSRTRQKVLALCQTRHGRGWQWPSLLQSALGAAETQFWLELGFLVATRHCLKSNYKNKRLWWSLHKKEVKQEDLRRQGHGTSEEVCVGLLSSFLILWSDMGCISFYGNTRAPQVWMG